MKKVVYLVSNKTDAIRKILIENGFEVLVGDGTLRDDMLAKCWAMVPGRAYITKETLDKAPNLKFICKHGVGVDRIDINACTERMIPVANTPASNAIAVAEHTIALMLAVAKQIYPISIYLRREYPEYTCCSRYPATELSGKTLAVIGLGNIGLRVAKIANAFDMRIIGYDPYANPEKLPSFVELYPSLDELLPEADFVTMHVAGVEANRNMMDGHAFSMMKNSAIFINTTRGFIVDERALYDALVGKSIAGAGLDVFVDDPLKPGNPLISLENLVATPHSASNTPDSKLRGFCMCAQYICDFAKGELPASTLNKKELLTKGYHCD